MTPPPRRQQRADADYVPAHLRHFVFHSQDDFYVSRHFDPLLLSHLMYEGFLPIASDFQDRCFLLPKLHRQRCVLLLKPTPEHTPKSVRKKAKKFKFVLNRDFGAVVAGCHEKHGIPWLYPPIVQSFKTLFEAGSDGVELYPGKKVQFYTVEMYDMATDTLVAGELGYTVGSVYTSLTGFSKASGAGTVQLHALSKFLYLAGFKMWDLGMSMDYKMSLGAKDLERDDFLEQLYKWRPREVLMQLDESKKEGDVRVGVSAKALFDNTRLPTGTLGEEVEVSEKAEGGKNEKDGDKKKDAKEHANINEEDAAKEKREAGAKRKLSLNEEQQREEKKGRSEAGASPTSEADAQIKEKGVADSLSSSTG